MKINTEYTKNNQDSDVTNNVISAQLCFEKVNSKYTPGYLIVESNLVKEQNNVSLCELASFATLMVDDVNESENNSIYVTATVTGKKDQQKLYEWIEKYAGKENAEKIAPGLLESLHIEIETEDSVASRFAKYRKLYEEASVDEDESDSEEDKQDDDKQDDDTKDEDTDDNKDEDSKDDKTDEDEQDELTAVILEVAKGDEDKAKDELIEAGVDEDDIEIITDEDDEDDEDEDSKNEDKDEDKEETVKIKVAVDSFDALKEYLEGKGFNLEEELGGEIVTDDEDKEDDEEGEDGDSEEDVFSGFDDLDLFGGDEEGKDK